MGDCPSPGVLLRAGAGELSSLELSEIAAHLRACEACRNARADMVRTLADFAAFLAGDPKTPEKRQSSSKFAAALHARRQAEIHERSSSWAAALLLAAALMAAVSTGALLTRATVVVRPDEILRHAQRQRPLVLQEPAWFRVDVKPQVFDGRPRVSSLSTLRPIGKPASPGASPPLPHGVPDEVVKGLDGYGMDWREPLSTAAFGRWRGRLTARRDAVTRSADRIVLRTSSSDGSLREVELVLDRTSYEPVRMAWTLTGIGRLEIARAAPPPQIAAAGRSRLPRRGSGQAASIMDAELDARLALRAVELDLAGARVSNSGSSVLVAGTVELGSRKQQQALAAKLRALPSVELRVDFRRPPPIDVPTAVSPRLGIQLEEMFGGTEERDHFVPKLIKLARGVRERVKLLNGLDERYSDRVVSRLSPAARAKLKRLLDLHVTALNDDLVDLDRRLAILAGQSVPHRAQPLRLAPLDWRRRVQEAREPAETLAASIERFLFVDDATSPQSNTQRGLTAVWESINGENVASRPGSPR